MIMAPIDESTKSVRVSWEDCYDGRYKVRLEKEEYVKILEYFESFIKFYKELVSNLFLACKQ